VDSTGSSGSLLGSTVGKSTKLGASTVWLVSSNEIVVPSIIISDPSQPNPDKSNGGRISSASNMPKDSAIFQAASATPITEAEPGARGIRFKIKLDQYTPSII